MPIYVLTLPFSCPHRIPLEEQEPSANWHLGRLKPPRRVPSPRSPLGCDIKRTAVTDTTPVRAQARATAAIAIGWNWRVATRSVVDLAAARWFLCWPCR